jgi:hypothetical protein
MENEDPRISEAVEDIENARFLILEAIEKAKAGTEHTGTLDHAGDRLDMALEALGHPVESPVD